MSVFTKNISLSVKGWNSLKSYKVGIVKGVKFSDDPTKNMNRQIANGPKLLFKMLSKNRFDVAVYVSFDSKIFIQKLNLHSTIKELYPPLLTIESYHYLNKKNIDIVAKVTAILSKMKYSIVYYKS